MVMDGIARRTDVLRSLALGMLSVVVFVCWIIAYSSGALGMGVTQKLSLARSDTLESVIGALR